MRNLVPALGGQGLRLVWNNMLKTRYKEGSNYNNIIQNDAYFHSSW